LHLFFVIYVYVCVCVCDKFMCFFIHLRLKWSALVHFFHLKMKYFATFSLLLVTVLFFSFGIIFFFHINVLYLLCSILSSFCDFTGFLFWYYFLSFVTILFLLHFVKNKEDYIEEDFQKLHCFSRKKVHIFFIISILLFSFYFCSLSYISRYMWLLILH
jgi:hypothetical protein